MGMAGAAQAPKSAEKPKDKPKKSEAAVAGGF